MLWLKHMKNLIAFIQSNQLADLTVVDNLILFRGALVASFETHEAAFAALREARSRR